MEIDNPQIDLMYIESILVTSGENSNQDFFIPEDLYEAISTPLHKPLDWEHHAKEDDPKREIIGTITNSWFEDLDGNKLEPEKFSDMPVEFNVATQSVLWKYLYNTRANEVQEGLNDSSLFVSMEMWFRKFDFVIKDSDKYYVVANNKNTAFLKKHLLRFGGNGTYSGKRILCAPRKFIFGGQGIVKNPANLRSDIKEVVASNTTSNIIANKTTIIDVKNNTSKPKVSMRFFDRLL